MGQILTFILWISLSPGLMSELSEQESMLESREFTTEQEMLGTLKRLNDLLDSLGTAMDAMGGRHGAVSEGKVLVERQEMPTDGLQAVTDDGNSTEVTGATEATEATGITEDTQLNTLDILPDDYDKRQFPPRTNEDSVNVVSITMDIFSIPQLDEKKEEIMLEVRLSHSWYDTRLQTEMFNETLELVPEAIVDFWTPDSYFHHAKDTKNVKLIKEPASLRITPNKLIKYTMMTMVTIGCPMSYHFYPMDHQTCRLELQSFGYSLNYNNYTWRRQPSKKDINLDNHGVKIVPYSFNYTSDDLKYPGLGVAINLKRFLVYHIIQTYIPSVIYVTVAWLSFLVPSDIVPGRMVLCVTTLLTLTSMFNSVRTMTPQVSYMKALDLWVFICICFVFSSLVEYGLVLHLTSRSAWQKRVDSHIRGLTGKSKLKDIHPVELLGVAVNRERRTSDDNTHPDVEFIDMKRRRSVSLSISPVSPQASRDPNEPSPKERLAYTIEFSIKIVYPLMFVIFNAAYWGFYLNKYNSETPEVFEIEQ